jgi:Ca-activated chloride channel family protein
VSLAYPWVLILFPAFLILAYLLRKKPRRSLPVPSLLLWNHKGPGRARYLWLPKFLSWSALALLVIVLARPQAGSTHSMQVTEGIAIQMLVDVSSSMDMNMTLPEGIQKTRLEIAKEMVESFIVGDGEDLLGREGDMIGLITFARYADTRSPLTFGHSALVQLVRNLRIQDRLNEDGTAYGDALALAAARLENLEDTTEESQISFSGPIASKVIILLTDGENNSGNHLPVEAAGLAKKWDCKVYSISLGDQGTGGSGDSPPLSSSERVLEHISKETGGLFRKAFDYQSLQSVYEEIDQLEQSEISTLNYNQVSEFFWLPLALALICWLMALTLESTWLRTVP